MKRFAVGKNVAPVVPQEFLELLQFDHVTTLELYILGCIEFRMEKLYNPFIFCRVKIIHLKQGFQKEIPHLYQRIIKGAENIEYFIPSFVLCREETVSLEETLINIRGKVGDIENKLLLIDNHLLLLLHGQVLAFLDKWPQHL